MKQFQLNIPRNIFNKLKNEPQKLINAVTLVIENTNFQGISEEVLNDYCFNNKPYMKKVMIEIVMNPRAMTSLYTRARGIEADISQLVTIALDLVLYTKDPDYKGLGFKFKNLERDKLIDVLIANVHKDISIYDDLDVLMRSEITHATKIENVIKVPPTKKEPSKKKNDSSKMAVGAE